MIKSENGKKIIAAIPSDLILTETDSPFITDSSIPDVINYLSLLWKKHTTEVESIIAYNFNNLIQRIK
jgi:Tat protein secretion system quality control protein TatD with DNase activity